jgi:hypothetical protein
MVERENDESKSMLAMALDKVIEVVRDGLGHGFFECKITAEVVQGRKRSLTIQAGKSHRFVIEESELSD